MKTFRFMAALAGAVSACMWCPSSVSAQAPVQAHIVITDTALRNDLELPPLRKEDITVKLNKKPITPSALIPAQGDQNGLQLMILIDDTLDSSVGNNLTDLKEFIKGVPNGTQVGLAYMSNTAFTIAQNFTNDRELAANAIRLPRGSLSSMDSSFLSLISLLKGWPQQKVRREVIMVTDGIDRLRGVTPTPVGGGPYGAGMGAYSARGARGGLPPATVYHSMPTISVDANSASEISQRYNVLVHSIYAPGVGRAGRSSWDLQTGLSGLSKIAEETGGECFSLGTSQLVSFQPYLERLGKMLSNQYYVVFQATPGKKAGFQRVKIETELSNSEILAPDNVWVATAE